jgi:hypothetical protein
MAQMCSPQQQREYPIEAARVPKRVPHAAMDRRVWGSLDGPDGATGGTRHVRAERKRGVPSPGGTRGYLKPGELKSGIQGVLKVVKGAPHGTQSYSRVLKGAHAPDGATAGTAVPGASVGERMGTGVGTGVNGGVGEGVGGGVGEGVGEGVTAQTHAS